jgi:hypothetical protein
MNIWLVFSVIKIKKSAQDFGMDTTGEKEKRMSKKNVNGRSTSSHDKKFRTRSVAKQTGMAFGFRKMAAAVIIKPD